MHTSGRSRLAARPTQQVVRRSLHLQAFVGRNRFTSQPRPVYDPNSHIDSADPRAKLQRGKKVLTSAHVFPLLFTWNGVIKFLPSQLHSSPLGIFQFPYKALDLDERKRLGSWPIPSDTMSGPRGRPRRLARKTPRVSRRRPQSPSRAGSCPAGWIISMRAI